MKPAVPLWSASKSPTVCFWISGSPRLCQSSEWSHSNLTQVLFHNIHKVYLKTVWLNGMSTIRLQHISLGRCASRSGVMPPCWAVCWHFNISSSWCQISQSYCLQEHAARESQALQLPLMKETWSLSGPTASVFGPASYLPIRSHSELPSANPSPTPTHLHDLTLTP